jgi:multicomponent Na+:H+ antiporter subunit G
VRWLLALAPLVGLAVAADEGATIVARIETGPVADVLIVFGCLFIVAGAVGMLRFPDFYTRLHAATKLITLGGIGLFGGAALAFAGEQAIGRVLLVAGFFFLTAPLSAYMIARAGYLRGLEPYVEEGSVDDWGERGAAVAGLARLERTPRPDESEGA